MKTYQNEVIELIDLAKLMGINVRSQSTEDFDLTTYGSYDADDRTICMYYEKEITPDAATVFTLAHELRHAYQHLTGRFNDYWFFVIGMGPKPPIEVKNALEADADDWALKYCRGRGIRVPKHLLTPAE
jgi:hypothetical protein